MDAKKLKQAIKLSEQIEVLETITKNAKNQKCEWIVFTFGNGRNTESVCTDPTIIEKVRQLIVSENELKLSNLKKEFEQL